MFKRRVKNESDTNEHGGRDTDCGNCSFSFPADTSSSKEGDGDSLGNCDFASAVSFFHIPVPSGHWQFNRSFSFGWADIQPENRSFRDDKSGSDDRFDI